MRGLVKIETTIGISAAIAVEAECHMNVSQLNLYSRGKPRIDKKKVKQADSKVVKKENN